MNNCNCNQERLPCTCKPVPPAVDVFVQRYAESCGEGGGVYPKADGDLCDYAHVTRLTAERDGLLAEVEQEKQRHRVHAAQLINQRGQLREERDALQSELTKARVWERFAGYLLDNCEGELIYEESLQHWVSEMLRKEANPIAHNVDESCGQDAKCDSCGGFLYQHSEFGTTCEACSGSRKRGQDAEAAKGGA